MIRIASISASGNEELANFCVALMQDRGLKTQLQQVTHSIESASKRQFNVLGFLGDPLVDRKTRKGLLLLTHLDTTIPGLPEHWTETQGDPYAAIVKEGQIHGLGSADAKIDFACKLKAIEKFRERKLKMPIYLVGTCGKELGMFGARYLIKSMSLNPKFTIVGDPTGLKTVYSHKSFHLYRISLGFQMVERDAKGFNRRIDLHSFGRSAHGADPASGVNAIQQATDFLKEAVDNGFEIRFTKIDGGEMVNLVPDKAKAEFYLTSHQLEDFKRFFREIVKQRNKERAFRVELGGLGDMGVRFLPEPFFPCLLEINAFVGGVTDKLAKQLDATFSPPHSTVSWGAVKQRLGGVDLLLDVRLLPDRALEEFNREIQEGIRRIAAQYPQFNLSATPERSNGPLTMTANHELVKLSREALAAAGLPVELGKSSATTEAAQFQAAGYEAIAFGPGKATGNAHAPNEHCSIADIEKAVAFYENVIERACL